MKNPYRRNSSSHFINSIRLSLNRRMGQEEQLWHEYVRGDDQGGAVEPAHRDEDATANRTRLRALTQPRSATRTILPHFRHSPNSTISSFLPGNGLIIPTLVRSLVPWLSSNIYIVGRLLFHFGHLGLTTSCRRNQHKRIHTLPTPPATSLSGST